MSDQYSFIESGSHKNQNVLDTTVLVEDGIVWNQDDVRISLGYSDDGDETLIEQNDDNYLTANETGNDTHYFSLLDNTTEASLNELNEIAISYNQTNNSEIDDQSSIRNICMIGGQPEIYRIEGSDDLYAFELTCDQDGNIQKLRYKLRLNENGEYESVVDSIEVVPLENDLEDLPPQEEPVEDEPCLKNDRITVKQESKNLLSDMQKTTEYDDELHTTEEDDHFSNDTTTFEETKSGILEQKLLPIHKLEALESISPSDGTFIENKTPHEILHPSCNELDSSTHNGNISSINSINEDSEHVTQFCTLPKEASGEDEEEDEEEVEEDEEEENADEEEENADETIHKQHNYEQILMIENHECVEEQGHNQISSSCIQNVNEHFVPELNDNSQDTMESMHSEESEVRNIGNAEYFGDPNETGSDTDDYHIVEGVHVTADTDTAEDTSPVIESFLHKESLPVQPQILKIQQQIPVLQSAMQEDKLKEMINNNLNKTNKGVTYYVVKHPEKENVAAIAACPVTNKVVKANPRSLLKSSYLYYETKKEKEKPIVQKVEKKILKNKEAIQARVLHNFIAKTTIVHAPVRQQRLPRKQTIKPVARADEEIIVQEVVVSSNGYVETSQDGVVRSKVPLKPTEIVQLSDSDDDYNPKKENKKKKKYKKRKSKVPSIVISDSDEEVSDEDVVQVDLSADSENDNEQDTNEQTDEESATAKKLRRSLRKSSVVEQQDSIPSSPQNAKVENTESSTKKRRGRPPKRRNSSSNDNTTSTDTSSSSSKKQRRSTKDSLESNEDNENDSEDTPLVLHTKNEIQNIKTNWKCSKCPKTFPSQGSLKSHMQYHTFHEPNNKAVKQSVNKQEEVTFKKPEAVPIQKNKYVCSHCRETFKNNILLSRHLKAHETGSKSLECTICKKIFADGAQLINHKRTHIKEQMFKTTTLPKHSPPKRTIKSSKNSCRQFKCDFCTKIFTSLALLNSHVRIHKQFTCSTCSTNFISKFALEEHIRLKCVKQSKSKSPVQSVSLKTRKSFIAPPSRISRRIWLRKPDRKTSPLSNSSSSSSDKEKKNTGASFQCDSCPMKFATNKLLFSHKVIKHGLNTPDKSLIIASSKRKVLHKEAGTHSSVPAGERLRSAYASIRTKLDM